MAAWWLWRRLHRRRRRSSRLGSGCFVPHFPRFLRPHCSALHGASVPLSRSKLITAVGHAEGSSPRRPLAAPASGRPPRALVAMSVRLRLARLLGGLFRPRAEESARTCHGVTWTDPYAWMENRRDPELEEYLAAESRHFQAAMGAHSGLIARLEQEISANAIHGRQETIRYGPYEYYCRRQGSDQIDFRRRVDGVGDEQQLFCRRGLGERFGPDAALTSVKIDIYHRLALYQVDSGNEEHAACVIDYRTGQILDVVRGIWNAEWAGPMGTFVYTRTDHLKRPCAVFAHTVGHSPARDPLVFEDSDDRYFVDIARCKDGSFITINSNSKTSSEVRVLPANAVDAKPRLVQARGAFTYFVEHRSGQFVIATNADGCTNFKIVRCPVHKPGKLWWREFVPHNPEQKIDDLEVLRDACVVFRRTPEGVLGIECHPFYRKQATSAVRLPEEHRYCGVHAHPTTNPISDVIRFATSTPLLPLSEWEYSLPAKRLAAVSTAGVHGFDPMDYTTKRIHARSRDGTSVPMTVVHPAALKRDGTSPLLLLVYGAYGESLELDYQPENMALLRRGFVLAFCHVRGGGELGGDWYNQGRQQNKHHSMEDFEACVRHLHSEGYSRPAKTAARGASAGGLVVAAVCNEAPDLFAAVVLKVPFVDVLHTMLDSTLPLTIHEQDEWGDPITDPAAFEAIRQWCPYSNIRAQRYPAMMVSASTQDERVPVWQPAKYVAQLRAKAAPSSGSLVLRTDRVGGHFGNHATLARDLAQETAFLAAHLDATELQEPAVHF